MEYQVNRISSLQSKASAQVAISLCQGNCFKEVVLQLDKPTYGFICEYYATSFFVSDPEKISTWTKVKEDNRLLSILIESRSLLDREMVQRWDTAVDEQCRRLTEGIPRCLRQGIHAWMRRIAMEYLCYSKRQEWLFKVSRYLVMSILTRGDWKEDCGLDEEKIARRLLEDERMTVSQRYRMACVYCLHAHIPQLWKRLTQEEKNDSLSDKAYSLISLWSRHMGGDENKNTAYRNNPPWISAVAEATLCGNRSAVMACWRELQKDVRQKMVIDRALQSLEQCQIEDHGLFIEHLINNFSPGAKFMSIINLPFYHRELVIFFLSQMDKEQQLSFFNKAFQNVDQSSKFVLEFFLDWPHQDNFLPMINQLWGTLPKNYYGQCLLTLAHKYSDEREKRDCDYRSLLGALCVETPDEYKQYIFCDKKYEESYSVVNEGKELLYRLLKRSHFAEKDESLFKRVFRDQPQEERRAMMLSEEGGNLCSLLIRKEKWCFLNGFLEKCLSKEEITGFKKQFIQSDCGVKLCLDALEENRERLVEYTLDCCLVSDAEKTQCKHTFISGMDCLEACESLLCEGKFAEVDCVINFCVSSDESKERFRMRFAESACISLYCTHDFLLDDCVWKQMDAIVAWSADTEEKKKKLKKDIFSQIGIDIHVRFVFGEEWWEKVERFYRWFDLTSEEIKKLKKDTLFSPAVIEDLVFSTIRYNLRNIADKTAPLLWCLTDEKLLIDFKKEVEEKCFSEVLGERDENESERLDLVMRELLDAFRKAKKAGVDERGKCFCEN